MTTGSVTIRMTRRARITRRSAVCIVISKVKLDGTVERCRGHLLAVTVSAAAQGTKSAIKLICSPVGHFGMTQ
jgi:hypothetical protein